MQRRVGLAVMFLCACGANNGPPLTASLAGTWGGPAQASFSAGGSYSYDAAMVVAVSGNTGSVAGVCPDGTGTLSVTGSGDSASFTGTFTCPAIGFSGCDGVVFTYSGAYVTLSGPTSLTLTATGSASGCGETFGLMTTFDGTLAAAGANPVPDWDLRFKAVGASLVTTPVLGGGAAPGVEDSFNWTGHGLIAWGLVAGGGFLMNLLYGAAQTAVYQSTLWLDGATCPATFAAALAGNNVITALDGDPYQPDAICILLGVAQPDGGPTFRYLTEEAVPTSHILDELSATESARSYVVTVLFAVDAGLYTYVAESVGPLTDGGYEQFETLIQAPLLADLAATAEDLADAGYVITASAWQGEPNYVLVGTRAVGSTAIHATVTMMTNDLTYLSDTQSMLTNGYVPVSLLQDYYPLPDGGLGADTWLIGEK